MTLLCTLVVTRTVDDFKYRFSTFCERKNNFFFFVIEYSIHSGEILMTFEFYIKITTIFLRDVSSRLKM